jgi:hypothetical protein
MNNIPNLSPSAKTPTALFAIIVVIGGGHVI